MSNFRTLKKLEDRTPEERREIGRKGGRASVKRRRELKEARDYMKALLSLPLENVQDVEALEAAGFHRKNLNRLAAVLIGQIRKAEEGDTRAAELVLKMIGEFPSEKAEITTKNGNMPETITIRYVDSNGDKWIEHRNDNAILKLPDNGRDPEKWTIPEA